MSPKAQVKCLKRYIGTMTGRQIVDRTMLQSEIHRLGEQASFISFDRPEYQLLERLLLWSDLWHDGDGPCGSSLDAYLLGKAQRFIWDALDS